MFWLKWFSFIAHNKCRCYTFALMMLYNAKACTVIDINASQQTRLLVIRRNLCTPVPPRCVSGLMAYRCPDTRLCIHARWCKHITKANDMIIANTLISLHTLRIIPIKIKKKTKNIYTNINGTSNSTKNNANIYV